MVFPPRVNGGGFARPGLVLMIYDSSFYNESKITPIFLRYLAHEVSHLWWHQAPPTNWQDWLNESFAEFTALLILRDYFGEEIYSNKIQSYRKSAKGTPPIRNISRSDKDAYKVLYQKGPVILADLEAFIGRKAFSKFLRTLVEEKVDNTEKCLEILEKVVSKQARHKLETALSEYEDSNISFLELISTPRAFLNRRLYNSASSSRYFATGQRSSAISRSALSTQFRNSLISGSA